jgi:hypothetical protein
MPLIGCSTKFFRSTGKVLSHIPNPVVRLGCMPFGTGDSTTVPSSDLGAMQAILPIGYNPAERASRLLKMILT